MIPEHEQLQRILAEAADIKGKAERDAYLNDACQGDPQLRTQIEQLLKAHENAGGFLNEPVQFTPDSPGSVQEGPGTIIGHYKLLEEIGEGGFGEVFLAEQIEPIRRKVALKIVKPGMDTKEVIARFETERQALAMMDHPNIAQVYDAGVINTGRPYFVMELVHGIPLIDYCNEHRLPLPDRLRLFQQVCEGVQHAHQKGIIHRDLKPSNILVSEENGKPLPKVIDFGVAKSLQGRLTGQTFVTMQETIIGTPLYMSPEQLNGDARDIDTRADIYALGVILYELLVGTTPLHVGVSHQASLSEIKEILVKWDIPRPSRMLHSLWDRMDFIAYYMQLKPQALAKLLRGDLDWVVMKAMEKDRARRYADVGDLAKDLDHFLKHEPVSAGSPGMAYRSRKFIRRHRVGLVMMSSIGIILVTGVSISTISLLRVIRETERARIQESRAKTAAERAQEQERLAIEASERARKQKNLADASKQLASKESERAEQKEALAEATFSFLTDELFLRADPAEEPDRDIKLRTVVDQAAERLDHHLNDQPLEKGRIHQMLATLYLRLAEYDKARNHADEAVRLVGNELGSEDPKTLACLHDQADAMYHQGQYEEAEEQFAKVLEVRRRVLGVEHPETLHTMRDLTLCLYAQEQYEAAEQQFHDILEIQQKQLGPDHPELLQTSYDLAMVLNRKGLFQKAEEIHRDVYKTRRKVLGMMHPDTLRSIRGLTQALYGQGKLEEAKYLQRDLLGYQKQVLGPEHPDTLVSMHDLAQTLYAENKWVEAGQLFRQLMEYRQESLGPNHPQTLQHMRELADVLERRGRLDAAEQLYRRLFETWMNIRGANHPETLDMQHALANVLHQQIKYGEAEQLAMEELKIRTEQQGIDDPDTLAAMELLAASLYDLGKYTAAEQYYRQAIQIRSDSLGSEHPETLAARYRLALSLITPQSSAEAEQILRQTLNAQQRVLGETHSDTLQTMGVLASVLRARRQYKEADALDQQILELHKQASQSQEIDDERI